MTAHSGFSGGHPLSSCGVNIVVITKEEAKIVKEFIRKNYKHFNSATVIDAAEAYVQHLKKGGIDGYSEAKIFIKNRYIKTYTSIFQIT